MFYIRCLMRLTATTMSGSTPAPNELLRFKECFLSDGDMQLVRALQKQEPGAFEQLIRLFHAQMRIVAAGIVGDAQAEEVVQEAWILVHRNIDKFEGRSALKTWVYSIVSNAARSRLRSEKRHRMPVSDLPGSAYGDERYESDGHWQNPPPEWDIQSPEGLLEEQQLRHCIEKTLGLLPDTQKAVFTLRDLEQLPLDEICNMLDVSESNVRVLLHRARVKLMQVIDHYQETGTY